MSPNKQRGFSLLEVLIAFTILAFSLTILLRIFSTGVNSATVSEEYTAAVQIAESLLAKASVENKLKHDHKVGEEAGKYRWEMNITPVQFISGKFKQQTTAELLRVDVLVSWGDDTDSDRQVQLTTLKLANKETL